MFPFKRKKHLTLKLQIPIQQPARRSYLVESYSQPANHLFVLKIKLSARYHSQVPRPK